MQNVSDIIAKESVELSGGSIKNAAGEVLLRVKTRKSTAEAFAQLPILTSSMGQSVPLGELATLKNTFSDDNTAFTYNNKPAIEIEVYRLGMKHQKEFPKPHARSLMPSHLNFQESVIPSL